MKPEKFGSGDVVYVKIHVKIDHSSIVRTCKFAIDPDADIAKGAGLGSHSKTKNNKS